MKKTFSEAQYNHVLALYQKLQTRLNKHFSTGRFRTFSKQKQSLLLHRLEKLKRQLSFFQERVRLAGAVLAVGAALYSTPAVAQITAQGSEFRINSYTTSDQEYAYTAMDSDGDFVIIWSSDAQDGSSNGIYGQRYNSSGVTQGGEFRINTYTTGSQRFPHVAGDVNGNFVVVWQSASQDGNNEGIYAQLYNSSGVAQGTEFKVNTYTTGGQQHPKVAMDSDGDFVVVWESYLQDGDALGIYGQRFNASGTPQGIEFLVNTYTTSNQFYPAAAMDSDGDFVVTWGSGYQDGSNSAVVAKRFNSSGIQQGAEFVVNTYTTGFQQVDAVTNPIAMDADGDFIIVWSSGNNQDGDNNGIYAQRFNSFGIANGSEFLVNTYTTGGQYSGAVSIFADESFVIAWSSPQDGAGSGIYAQHFNSSGVKQGSELIVNTYTTSSQNYPVIASAANGDMVITWKSLSQDGSNGGVYGQRYDGPSGNTQPVISPQQFSISENSNIGTAVGIVIASDADAGQNLSYSIIAGNSDGKFSINSSTGEITTTGLLDYEATSSYGLTIEVTDNGAPSKSASAVMIINVTDIVETGIQSGIASKEILLHPNPANNMVSLSLQGETTILIVDLSGQVIRKEMINDSTFSVEGMRTGTYIIEITQNEQKVFKKLIVE